MTIALFEGDAAVFAVDATLFAGDAVLFAVEATLFAGNDLNPWLPLGKVGNAVLIFFSCAASFRLPVGLVVVPMSMMPTAEPPILKVPTGNLSIRPSGKLT